MTILVYVTYLYTQIIGIWTTRKQAIEQGRNACKHKGDEYAVREFFVNEPNHPINGATIWNSRCDREPEHRGFFARYWHDGFPINN